MMGWLAIGLWLASAGLARAQDAIPLPPIVVTAPRPVTPPRPRELGRPPYPESARRQGLEGTVTLLVRVLRDGRSGEVTVKRSSGHAALDDAAVSAARSWTFEPASQGRALVEAWVEVPVRFELGAPK